MRRRATRMIMTAVVAVIFVLGVPAGIMAGVMMWNSNQTALDVRAQTVARAVDRRLADDNFVPQSIVAAWSRPIDG